MFDVYYVLSIKAEGVCVRVCTNSGRNGHGPCPFGTYSLVNGAERGAYMIADMKGEYF